MMRSIVRSRIVYPATALLLMAAGGACGFIDPSTDVQTGQAVSPDQKWVAFVVDTRCNHRQLCDPATRVLIEDRTSRRRAEVARFKSGGYDLSLKGADIYITLQWNSDHLLSISYPGPAVVEEKKDSFESLHLVYRSIPFL
jgi:hypothetical protein